MSESSEISQSCSSVVRLKSAKDITHCAFCGGILRDENIEGRIRKLCGSCGCVNYQNPIPSIAAIITDNSGGLLLVKRSVEPGVGLWCLPGGFMELGETPEETVVREVLEETGLHVKPGAIFDACSRIGGYHGDVVIIAYPAEVLDGELNPGDDASDVEYFPIDQLPEIAFLSHARFIDKYFS